MAILLLLIIKIVLWEMETSETTQHQIHILRKKIVKLIVNKAV